MSLPAPASTTLRTPGLARFSVTESSPSSAVTRISIRPVAPAVTGTPLVVIVVAFEVTRSLAGVPTISSTSSTKVPPPVTVSEL